MKNEKYKLSFTTGSLYLGASIKIAELYLQLKDWKLARQEALKINLLQSRTNSSAIRLYRELAQRLQVLSDEQLELFVEGTLQEQKQLLWVAVCKRYAFIQEFATEVLHEKYLVLDYELTDLDYDSFFNRKADWHPELDQITEKTKDKLKQVLFRMLRESELISDERVILPTMLSTRVIQALQQDASLNYRVFPVSDRDLSGYGEHA